MQRINEAHAYMSTRTQAARKTEWERAQRPSGSLDELHRNVEERMRKEREQKAKQSAQTSTFRRDWKPKPETKWDARRRKWADRKRKWNGYLYRHPLARWMVALVRFLLLLAGRLAVVAGMYAAYAGAVFWGTKSLAHGAWVLLLFFPGIPITFAGFIVTTRFALNFLHGGWKGIGDYLMDRRHEGLIPEPDAWTRKTSNTRWI
jgi:ABC-type multidrug transport system fused ATPase/permease subunit